MLGLYKLKPWYTQQLSFIVNTAVSRRISPDVFTTSGVVFAVFAGLVIAFAPHIFSPLVFVFLALRLAGANLDGAVARARGVSRPFGFLLNEIGDLFGSLLPLLAVGFVSDWKWVLATSVVSMFPTFVSLSGSGAGVRRVNGGLMGKTERALLLSLGAVLGHWPVVLGVIAIGSLVTAIHRTLLIRKELGNVTSGN